MALLCSAYGWTPAEVSALTPQQVAYFIEQMPEVFLRFAYPVAGLEAGIRNMMGGKRKPKDSEDKDPPLAEHELFTATELLPWYARPGWVESANPGIRPEAARDFLKHKRDVPAWVIEIAPLDAIKRAAEQS